MTLATVSLVQKYNWDLWQAGPEAVAFRHDFRVALSRETSKPVRAIVKEMQAISKLDLARGSYNMILLSCSP